LLVLEKKGTQRDRGDKLKKRHEGFNRKRKKLPDAKREEADLGDRDHCNAEGGERESTEGGLSENRRENGERLDVTKGWRLKQLEGKLGRLPLAGEGIEQRGNAAEKRTFYFKGGTQKTLADDGGNCAKSSGKKCFRLPIGLAQKRSRK